MILQQLFAIKDAPAEHYLPPFASHNTATAIRQFEEACLQEGHEFNKRSGDYSLHHVGTFDAASGVIAAMTVPVLVIQAADMVRGAELPAPTLQPVPNTRP